MVADTSLLAWFRVLDSGQAQTWEVKVLETLLAHPGLTSREVMEHLGVVDPNLVRPRISDLVRSGRVVCDGKRLVGGKLMKTWRTV
jgi:hypothetical protein